LGERGNRKAVGEGVRIVTSEKIAGTTKPEQPRRKRRTLAREAIQIDRARDLRKTETKSEKVAWRLLRTIRFKDFKFRRQHPLCQYIVDFYSPQRRLVVELDGSVHGRPSQTKRDVRRDAQLRGMGYAVARYSNGMVLDAPGLFVDKVVSLVWSLPEAFADKL